MPAKAVESEEAAPVTPTAGERKKPPSKPNQEAFDKEIEQINANIEKLRKKQEALKATISGGDNGKDAFSARRKELRAKLDELNAQKEELNAQRSKHISQLSSIQNNIRKKADEIKSARDKLPFKATDVDKQIAALEKQLETGELKLIEEKKVVQEISNLRKSKSVIASFASQQEEIDNEKKSIEEIRKKIDELEPRRKALRSEIDTIRSQLSSLDQERQKEAGSRKSLYDERNELQTSLNAEYDKKRSLFESFRREKDEYYSWAREERARRVELVKVQRQKEQEERLAKEAEKERELAEVPAYTEEINLCQTLATLLQSFVGPSDKSTPAVGEKAKQHGAIRQVDSEIPDGAQVLTKKSDRDDAFLVLGGKKGGKRNRPSTHEKAKPLKFDLVTMEQFFKLKVDIPVAAAEIDKTIVALNERKAWYLENQAAKTAENKAKAEAKIAALKQKESTTDETNAVA